MNDGRRKLGEAASAARDAVMTERERAPDQLGLFGASAPPQLPAPLDGRGGARPGAGRPPGALNRSSRELAGYVRRKGYEAHGIDAIERDYELALQPLATDRAALQAFAEHLGCDRLEAFKVWQQCKRDVYPFIYPRLANIEVLPPGAPGGDRLLVEVDGIYGEEAERFVEITAANLPLVKDEAA